MTDCVGCGEPSGRFKFCSDDCKPRCSVDGCESPSRKRSWCASHYAQWRHMGRDPEPFQWKWADLEPCIVCGTEHDGSIARRFCSHACRQLHRSHDGDVPTSTACIACGVDIDLTKRGRGGQRKKANTKFCARCKRDYRKYKASAPELARRDGAVCGICAEPVDMTLKRSESNMCASVDHIIPRALGGTHDPSNLQLAHLYCNQVKSDGRGAPVSTLLAGTDVRRGISSPVGAVI